MCHSIFQQCKIVSKNESVFENLHDRLLISAGNHFVENIERKFLFYCRTGTETNVISAVVSCNNIPKPVLQWCRCGKIPGITKLLFLEDLLYVRIYFGFIKQAIPQVHCTQTKPHPPPLSSLSEPLFKISRAKQAIPGQTEKNGSATYIALNEIRW